MLFFALKGSEELGEKIAGAGGFEISPHEEREFGGGEHKARPLVSVRGRDVYILHGLQGTALASANDRLCRLLFFAAACKENGAERVTVMVPYLAYSRKDRQTKPRDPVTTRYVASLFEAVGTDMVVTLDVHTIMAFQNAYRCRTLHLDTRKLFANMLRKHMESGPCAVVSPDGGGIKRAELFKEMLEAISGKGLDFGFMEKRRSSGVVSGSLFAGEVEGRKVFVIDDMIGSGGTLLRAARACKERGAVEVHALAAHGLFGADSVKTLLDEAIDSTTVTDSAIPFAVPAEQFGGRLNVVSVGPLIGETIRRLHAGGSIDELLEEI